MTVRSEAPQCAIVEDGREVEGLELMPKQQVKEQASQPSFTLENASPKGNKSMAIYPEN